MRRSASAAVGSRRAKTFATAAMRQRRRGSFFMRAPASLPSASVAYRPKRAECTFARRSQATGPPALSRVAKDASTTAAEANGSVSTTLLSSLSSACTRSNQASTGPSRRRARSALASWVRARAVSTRASASVA